MAVLTKEENVPLNPLSEALWCTTLDLIKKKTGMVIGFIQTFKQCQ
jgi:hypothetical protein